MTNILKRLEHWAKKEEARLFGWTPIQFREAELDVIFILMGLTTVITGKQLIAQVGFTPAVAQFDFSLPIPIAVKMGIFLATLMMFFIFVYAFDKPRWLSKALRMMG